MTGAQGIVGLREGSEHYRPFALAEFLTRPQAEDQIGASGSVAIRSDCVNTYPAINPKAHLELMLIEGRFAWVPLVIFQLGGHLRRRNDSVEVLPHYLMLDKVPCTPAALPIINGDSKVANVLSCTRIRRG
jgi:hypothetical protein